MVLRILNAFRNLSASSPVGGRCRAALRSVCQAAWVCDHRWESPLSAPPPQLEVLTNLANETNIPTVLREFQVQTKGSSHPEGPGRAARSALCTGSIVLWTRPSLKGPAWGCGYLRSSPSAFCWDPWAAGKGVTPLPDFSLWHDESLKEGDHFPEGHPRAYGGTAAGSLCCAPQTYIRSMDKDFVAATIQAIGRCATNIGRVRDTCLNGLVQLLSNRDGQCVAGCPALMTTGCLPACLPLMASGYPLSVQA